MRSESSFEMTSAATFLPAKLTAPASIDLKVEVNVTARRQNRRRGQRDHSGGDDGAHRLLFLYAAAEGAALEAVSVL